MSLKADLVLHGGRVWRGLGLGFAEAVAIWAGRIVATGSLAELDGLIGPLTKRIDLAGRLAMPGFNDAHMHLLPIGVGLAELDLRASQVDKLDDLLARVEARAAKTPAGQWILGRGYDHFRLDAGRHPTRDELDRAAPNHPVYLKRTCGHLAVLNSAAMALAGIDLHSADPEGGVIERENGRPSGLIAERALELVARILPILPLGTLVDGIAAGADMCLARGITSVMDAAVGNRQKYDDLRAYLTAQRTGRLPLRVNLCLTGGPSGIVSEAHAAGLISGVGDARLRIGPVKLFTDGSAGGRTAAMTEPYLGGDCGCGVLALSGSYVAETVMDLHTKGYQMGIHAIGDLAIGNVIAAVRKAQAAHPSPTPRRHRIEHCGFSTPLQIRDMARLGMICAPQPVFMYDFGDLYLTTLGEERPAAAYPMRHWIDAGLHPAASSDAPVCEPDPFPNLYTMVTRRTRLGTQIGAAQAIGLEEALSAMTLNGAYGSFEEGIKGTLEPGKLADIAVINRDLFACDPAAWLEDTDADLTLVEGKIAFDRHGETTP